MSQKNKIIERYGIWLADLICIGFVFVLSTYVRFGNFCWLYEAVHRIVGRDGDTWVCKRIAAYTSRDGVLPRKNDDGIFSQR